ncbi:hypothetical protein IW261DRAFT_1499449 [Armillaria novae-zelandiae]|uniref:Transmembrane protein n=1 Tax=Armillaria novae-zelandiae TaxID=153914 RepID=A0AA39NYT2_9AGAR|nr:hypothetical protein IW261DRAFT_1499449 [Armillaria novae-zelandiae]
MTISDNSGRSRTQGLIPDAVSNAYRGYGTMTAVLGQSQAADNSAGQSFLCGLVGALIFLVCTFIVLGGIFCAISGTWIVIGHQICLYFTPAPSPFSEASLWSTFLFGFLGSATTALPFCILYTSLDSDSEECLPAFLKLALVIAKIGLDCLVGVPLVGHYGVVTLKLGYAVLAAYTGVTSLILGIACIMIMLLLVATALPGRVEVRVLRNSDKLPDQAAEVA